jgi:hypothetical protein
VTGEGLQVAFKVDKLGLNSRELNASIGSTLNSQNESILIPVSAWGEPQLSSRFAVGALTAISMFVLSALMHLGLRRAQVQSQRLEAKIADAELKVENQPEKARPAWILAQTKLEAYFDRNLQQVNQVFYVAVAVMFVGFCFVMTGVVMSFNESKVTAVEIVASGAGVITEFIGATFMVIYKSTMAQANEFMAVLERINTVGMTVQVLDSIPEADADLKNKTRANIVELLLKANAVGDSKTQ